jgi:ABC-2 type transport system permease protein
MNTPTNAVPEIPVDSRGAAPAATPATRPMYWSVRRELWENRSIFIAPLCAAGVVIFSTFIGSFHQAERRRAALLLDPALQRAAIEKPYDMVAIMLLFVAFIVGVFYCLDALHGERRDRTILFWKSLPVSDLTTVLSKASIPVVVLPLLTFAITIGVQLVMLLMSNAALVMNGMSATTSAQLPFFQRSAMLFYGLIVMALWHAPIYGWLLLVSGWARHAAFLWAFLPLIAIQIFEKIAFGTSYCSAVVNRHFMGWLSGVFVPLGRGHMTLKPLTTLDPGAMLTTPDLWLGLGVAALLIAAAVRQRRYREPN